MMKKIITALLLGSLFTSLFTACSTEEVTAESEALNSGTNLQTVDVTVAELVGTWNMYSMTSVAPEGGEAVAVDFDQDGTYTYDLLEETDCFDSMYFIFYENGDVVTRQSRLYFSSTTGMFSCQTTGDYSATYEVSGNELKLHFTVNGSNYTETKTISRYSENGNEFLKVTLTKGETNSAVYVADDPGNTVASEIQKIETVYISTP